MTPRRTTLVLLFAMGLSACENSRAGSNEIVGTMAGAIVGGVVGDQFGSGSGNTLATGAGVLIGTLIGSEIGRSMDDVDRMRANQAVQRAYTAPLGDPIVWSNSNTGNSGTVTATREGRSSTGRYCREYRQTLIIDGRRETGIGVACLQPDATWRIAS
ncbi:RT0821/Lpp0805 family surface protein [uncultured Tateyamaria sp.]|uniref:RT0821/Lpp0805 family surface protein n=1 Tax=uncultured Tateyamaria sp. TaxID=455651 RepID=UPI0026311337|nr:RT0821/Lpp0805 family surface protein [uncultured Tateyamaria sp.]